MSENNKCLYPGCEGLVKTGGGRGLCPNHYVAAYYLVKQKGVTWEQLEKAGKCKAKRSVGSKSSWFTEGLK